MISKRVSLLIPSLHVGGAEKVFVNLANHFSESFRAVDLVIQETGSLETELAENVNLITFKSNRLANYAFELSDYFNKTKPDIVFSSLYGISIAALASKMLSRHKPKIIVGAHNMLSYKIKYADNRKDRFMLRGLAQLFYPFADVVVCVSHGVAEDLLQQIKIKKGKLNVIYNPVLPNNLGLLRSQPSTHPWLCSTRNFKTIITVARLVKQKGIDVLLAAIKLVHEDYPHIRLIVVGNGPEMSVLKSLSSKLGLDSIISFIGSHPNPFSLLSRADLFVSSSLWEGFGNTIVEALACSCPVIATDCESGPSEILANGIYGCLVPPADCNALAKAILCSLRVSPDREDNLYLVKRAEMFTATAIGDQYIKLAKSLL